MTISSSSGLRVVEVPAGRFNALKVVHESDRGDRNEYWYAPEIRSYVKWIWRRDGSRTEEQLREYRAAPRPQRHRGPVTAPTRPPAARQSAISAAHSASVAQKYADSGNAVAPGARLEGDGGGERPDQPGHRGQ